MLACHVGSTNVQSRYAISGHGRRSAFLRELEEIVPAAALPHGAAVTALACGGWVVVCSSALAAAGELRATIELPDPCKAARAARCSASA